jgi:hypothetical protein
MGCQVIDLKLFLQCDLDHRCFDPKIIRDHLLVMNNPHTEFEGPRSKNSLVMDRPSNKSKAIYPHFFEMGHNNITNIKGKVYLHMFKFSLGNFMLANAHDVTYYNVTTLT